MRVTTLLGSTLALASSAALAQAPFCVVTGGGENCSYVDANVCRQVAASSNGMCVPRSTQPQPQLQFPDIAGSYQRGAEAGQRMRIEREEHEAKMRLLEAQTEAAKSRVADAQPIAPTTTPSFTDGCRAFVRIASGNDYDRSRFRDDVEAGMSASYCRGYLNSFVFTQSVLVARAGAQRQFCLSLDTTTQQMAQAVVESINKLPNLESSPEGAIVLGTLMGRWPCPK